MDETGSTYRVVGKDSVIAEYDEEQKAACEAWNTELLVDIFPQASEFETPAYSPVWALSKPVEFDEIGNKLDEIAQADLISCVMASEADFDGLYDKMISELEGSGMADAAKMLTDLIQAQVAAQ